MEYFDDILQSLKRQDNYRTLKHTVTSGKHIIYRSQEYVNMSSNDYLGLSADPGLQREFLETVFSRSEDFLMSNPSSRLMTGNGPDYTALEEKLGSLYGLSALVTANGYMANTGVLPALTDKHDLIIADKLVHASLIDGMRLCECRWTRFNHNDIYHLESIIRKSRKDYRNIYVVTETIFSMDGDRAPLRELKRLKEEYGIRLYLDEAHAFGVCGGTGLGLAHGNEIIGPGDILVATFGKAVCSAGAFIICSDTTRELLINRMRTVIFTTALPPLTLKWTGFVIDRLEKFSPRRDRLAALIDRFDGLNGSGTHILPVMSYGNRETDHVAEIFCKEGFWVTPVKYPTVPKGKSRIRLSLSAFLSPEDVEKFISVWKSIG